MSMLLINICSFFYRNDPTRLLLTLGASLTMVDLHHKNTPLHWAVFARNNTAISLLLKAGANLDEKNAEVCSICRCDHSNVMCI